MSFINSIITSKATKLNKKVIIFCLKELKDYIKKSEPISLYDLSAWVEENEETRCIFNVLGGKQRYLYRTNLNMYSGDPYLRRGISRYLKHLGYKMYQPGELISTVVLKEEKFKDDL